VANTKYGGREEERDREERGRERRSRKDGRHEGIH